MDEKRFKEYSKNLNRDMYFNVYGHSGKPFLVFPTNGGRYFDYENFGMVAELSEFIENGEIQLICVDSIDNESWSNYEKPERERIELQEKYYHYIVDEIVPKIWELTNRKDIIATGNSMGGFHSAIVFFRRPDLFEGMLSLSGLFDASKFFGDYMDDLVYDNSPIHFLHNMPHTHPYLDIYKTKKITICIGKGGYEKELLPSNIEMERILNAKKIPVWVDYWGYDVQHDWTWWKTQIVYFVDKILRFK